MTVHLYLVRHGQTYFNVYNRLQGWSNSPLTESGRADAVRAGEKLADIQFDAAFCSDTTRAQDTARIILEKNAHARAAHMREAEAHMEFREQFYGYFEGRDMAEAWWAAGAPHGAPSYAAILEKFGSAATRDFLKEADPFHHAESDAEYWQRVERAYSIIAASPRVAEGSHVLVIAHGNTLLSLLQRFRDTAPAGIDLTVRPGNGSVTRLDFEPSEGQFSSALRVVSLEA
ncbi:histidine phosphatase family protein [Alloscardovia macacae]|uniref:Phosphoglycerate mutase n=1 Tax=Alloscardovia macacae TaxID=1160091 RepID=A0A261F1Q0_9BIFI|nr:histidine phosphatase family protein [Alloscardovia macacae]OZG53050.1 phosphoglycerate mutase [Alloscardovia macacae]